MFISRVCLPPILRLYKSNQIPPKPIKSRQFSFDGYDIENRRAKECPIRDTTIKFGC